MDSLHITLPNSHPIYFDLQGHSLSQPINGSLDFKPAKCAHGIEYSHIQLKLVRVVSSSAKSAAICKNQGALGSVRSRLSARNRSESVEKTVYTVENIKLLMPSSLQTTQAPDERKDVRIPFAIPIRDNFPGSETMGVGQISYEVLASLMATEEVISTTSRPIHLAHRLISDQQSIHTAQSYPLSKVIKHITLSQNTEDDSDSAMKFHMKVQFRKSRAPGVRPTEFTCPAIREIRWKLEETTRLFVSPDGQSSPAKNSQDHVKSMISREICNGNIKGHWSSAENPLCESTSPRPQDGSSVDIAFALTIPKSAKLAHPIHLSSYVSGHEDYSLQSSLRAAEDLCTPTEQGLMITNEHVLKLEIISGVETFEHGTNHLLERAPLRICLRPSFSFIPLGKLDNSLVSATPERVPPRYEEIPTAPPNYENHP